MGKRTGGLARGDAAQIAATACFWAWCYLWTSNAGDADWPIAGPEAFPFVRLAFWFGNGLGLAGFAALLGARRDVASRPFIVASALVMAAGSSAVLALGDAAAPMPLAAASFAAGLSCVSFLPGWRKAVSSMAAREAVVFIGMSACAALALFYGVLLLPRPAAMAAFVLLPLAGGGLALLDAREEARRYALPERKPGAREPRHARAFKWAYIALTLLVLAAMGLDTLGYSDGAPGNGLGWNYVGGLALSAAFWAVFAFGRRDREFSRYLIVPYMPLLVAFAFLAPFAVADAGTLLQIAISLDFACWCFLIAVGMDAAVQSVRSRVVHGIALALCPLAAFAAQTLASGASGMDGLLSAGTYAIVFATAVLVTFRIAFATQREMTEDDRRAAAAKAIAAEEGLSPREAEVFALLAYGHGQPYIQERLCIAPGTVKTHVKHIYAKLGIGSREELLDLVRAAQEEPL